MTNYNALPEEYQMALHQARNNLIDFQIVTNPQYIPNWHHELVAKELEHIEKYGDRDYKFLMVFQPPRHGKSQQCSIDFPAWYLGRNPDKEVITASYSGELAQDFGTKTREKVDSAEYQAVFGTRLKADDKAKAKWRTREGGSYTSVGVGGAITGRGANLLIIDDPLKNREEADSEVIRKKVWDWFTSTAFTRLEPNGVVFIILTRWHNDDLAGRILADESMASRTKVIEFPAIATHDDVYRETGEPLWIDRFNTKALDEIKKTIGPYDWCTPQETPILMSDWTTKPISEIKEGDFVVGFERGTPQKRAKLVKTKVIKTASRIDNVCDLTMQSGRTVRCTASHRWYTGRKQGAESSATRQGRKMYDVAKVGRNLLFVEEPFENELSNKEIALWSYLAGIIDGEGHIAPSAIWISQTVGKNQPVIDKIRTTLKELNIDFNEKFDKASHKHWSDKITFVTRNPKEVYRKLLRHTNIAKKDQIVDRMFTKGHMFVKEKDKVLDIKRGDKEIVYSLQTETGNYIAWGYASSNSALYQQSPITAENQEFKPEWYRRITEEEVELMNTRRFLTVDTAMSKQSQADYTGFVDNRVNNENFWHIKAWRSKIGPQELVDTLFTLHLKHNYEQIGIEKTAYLEGLRPFLESEQRKRNHFLPIVELHHRQTAKEVRIRGLIPRYASGSVFHVIGSTSDLESEQTSFPLGAHDDILDALAYQLQLKTDTNSRKQIRQYRPNL